MATAQNALASRKPLQTAAFQTKCGRFVRFLLVWASSVCLLGCAASISYQPTDKMVEELGDAQAKQRLEELLGRLRSPRLIDAEVTDEGLRYRFPRDRTWSVTDRSTSIAKQLIFRDVERITVFANNVVAVQSRDKDQTASIVFHNQSDAKMFADLLTSFRARGVRPTQTTVAMPSVSPSSTQVTQSPSSLALPSQGQPTSPSVAWRTALVIGNAAYPTQALSNPVHDATDLANVLRSLNFTVKVVTDANKPTIERAVDDFTKGVPSNTVGLFFFAGHGIQIDNSNYLLPIGTAFAAKSDVKFHAISADWVLARMEESGMAVKILLLDACRNDPFSRSWTRALDRGLAVMQAPEGAVIVYATAPGKTAEDGVGRNSPFTTVLLRELLRPKRPIVLTMQAVSEQVSDLTGKTGKPQTPYVTFAGRLGDFVFAP